MNSSKIYLPQIDKYTQQPNLPQDATRHYVTSSDGEIPAYEPFIDDEAYAQALSGAVIKCVDVVIMDPDKNQVLVATRDQEPMSGDWVFGGRKRAGETNGQTAVTNLKREFGINIDPHQLVDTGRQYDMAWDTREQPAIVGRKGQKVKTCHMSSAVYMLPVDKDEVDLAQHNEEFSRLKWLDIDEVLQADPGTYHPALQDMISDSIDSYTAPEPPKNLDEAVTRAVNHLNQLQIQKRGHDELVQKVGDIVMQLRDK